MPHSKSASVVGTVTLVALGACGGETGVQDAATELPGCNLDAALVMRP
jgi:hypothetical protein